MNRGTIRDVMTKDPVSMSSDALVVDAAKAMSDMRIGSVVVMDKDKPCGIVTDRDIAVRAVAKGSDPQKTTLEQICSHDLVAVRVDQSVEDVMQVMKSHDVKRVVVMSDLKLEGIVSLGDLARHSVGEQVMEDISKAEPNG